jgi:hypothetical protein
MRKFLQSTLKYQKAPDVLYIKGHGDLSFMKYVATYKEAVCSSDLILSMQVASLL